MKLKELLPEGTDEVIAVKDKADVIKADEILEKIGLEVFSTHEKRNNYLESDSKIENGFLIQDDDGWGIQSHYIGFGTSIEELEKLVADILQKQILKKEVAEEKALELKREIEEISKKLIVLHDEIALKEGELEEICPHLKTKIVNEYNEGGYLHRGSHVRKVVCVICKKEMSRNETDTGYA